MTIRIHDPETLTWRKIGDIPLGAMRAHIDPTELECHIAFHEPGDDATPQLMEMRVNPHALLVPHSHDTSEIYFVVEGWIEWDGHVLERGGSMFISARTPYSISAGAEGARLLNFRARADHSFRPEG